ncbi:hypothetical protein P5673_019268 [Acropora cervicornis]|uniref:Uncharacterized protein n=1 Tax=Acropora cervicornis TaxID=6130 RepID=A0AAD9QC42_ACRCE|nr:hypothetical protein P5673_019268 [Acropora cervicornis]
MTMLTGGSQYIYNGEEEMPGSQQVERHYEASIVQIDESIVPILALDKASQAGKELNSLDVQSTAALDADIETQRQNTFTQAIKLLAKKLRVKREISPQQEKVDRLEVLRDEHRRERRETEKKITRRVDRQEKKNILELLKKRHEALEQKFKEKLKLEQDVELEKLRKEAQNKLVQDLIKDANLHEEQANAIMKNHLANMAAIEKATDEERARRVMALEMRLAERRALVKLKQDQEERKKSDLEKLKETQSSTLSSENAAIYLERFKKELEAVNNKLDKERKRQQEKLHQKLTALKQRKMEEKVREHQQQIKEFEQEQNEKFEHVEFETVDAIIAKQKLLDKQRQDIEEIERNADREAAKEVEDLLDQQTVRANQLIKNNLRKMYQELVNKGLSESEKEAILERLMADVDMQQGAREDERRRQKEIVERKLEKKRAIFTLSKLRQRQMLEEKLSERRKRKMAQLEQRQAQEERQEKLEALKEEEILQKDELEAVREEMLAERSKRLEAHHEKLGEIIAQLQIEKAKQISKIAMQQEALGQLQAGLIDELESKGTFQDPETQSIMDKYQKDTKNLEDNLRVQKEKQEQALRERLEKRMKQRESALVLQQKSEMSKYISNESVNNMAMKLRKAAMKARHEKELNDLRTRMQKEIDQTINELKMSSDIRRMQAIETQNMKLISILVQQGKLQEDEIKRVLKYLFPKKRESTLEARIRRKSSLVNDSPTK